MKGECLPCGNTEAEFAKKFELLRNIPSNKVN